MKSQYLYHYDKVENHPLKLEIKDLPVPQNNQVRIKVKACAVCRTDLHLIEGELAKNKLPIVPGHQVVGIVDELGAGVKNFKLGDRVGAFWLGLSCSECIYCKNSKENLCDKALFTGYDFNGGYSEYMIAQASYLVRIQADLQDDNIAPWLCAGVIGYRSIALSQLEKDQVVGLFGFGASAHLCIQILVYLGHRVVVFTRSKNHQKHALSLGATWAGDVMDSFKGKVHKAIIFAPSGELIHHALRRLHKGGKITINAIHLSDIPKIAYQDLYYEKSIQSVTHCTREDANNFFKIAQQIKLQSKVNHYRLEDAHQALCDLKHSKIDGAPVLML
jgi:alcohol dehydrogenase, propanol-preferring